MSFLRQLCVKKYWTVYMFVHIFFHLISIMNRNTGSLPTPTIIITFVVFVLYIKSHHDCKTCNCHT